LLLEKKYIFYRCVLVLELVLELVLALVLELV
jgi:hypothetical protein